MKIVTCSFFALLLSLFCSIAFSQTFSSTNQPTQLIELYTSEGCSSCPPADRWLNKLKHDPQLWSKFIPVAFHVDYWDYIGWKDPFASSQFSARQRQYARESNLSSVYTPGMLLNGREWTAWRRQSRLSLPSNSNNTGKLSFTLDNGQITARYQTPAESQSSNLILNIAILGFNVKSNINAGENNGHIFTHDFVVLGFQHVSMKQSEEGIYTSTLEQIPALSQHTDERAISAWVNTDKSLTPLQATGGWIENP
jgi:hypothetical protein